MQKNKKLGYTLIMMLSVIIIIISLCVVVGLTINKQGENSPPNSGTPVNEDSSPNSDAPITEDSPSNSDAPVNEDSSPNSDAPTNENVFDIAFSLAQTFAQENNYTITTTKTALKESTRPYWLIEVEFEAVKADVRTDYVIQSSAYEITVWADTEEIWQHGQMRIITPPWAPNATEENVKITIDQAIEIAWSIAQEYAKENNRVIIITDSSCYLDSRPIWEIQITYAGMERMIVGYHVSIFGDTGEIRNHQISAVL